MNQSSPTMDSSRWGRGADENSAECLTPLQWLASLACFVCFDFLTTFSHTTTPATLAALNTLKCKDFR